MRTAVQVSREGCERERERECVFVCVVSQKKERRRRREWLGLLDKKTAARLVSLTLSARALNVRALSMRRDT